MERLHALTALGFILAVALACKTKKEDDTSRSTASSTAPAVETATASASASATEPVATATTSAAPAPTVKLENCGQRYAAPARLDGKCADYCGGDYKCEPNETCTPTSWPTKAGVRNTKVCAPKGVAVRPAVAGAAWDSEGPAQETSSVASAAPSAAPGDKNGEVDDDKGKCPAGWVLAEEACHRPCTKDTDCNPPKSYCKKWEGKKLCAFTGSLVVPND